MDLIKEAFSKAKQDIDSLRSQVSHLSNEIESLKSLISSLKSELQHKNASQQTDNKDIPAHPAQDLPLYGLKASITQSSTGNGGVPADRQTNQQTDQHTPKTLISTPEKDLKHLINSLGSIKEEVRLKLNSLTKQEMIVFLTIYQLEEEGFVVDYALLAKKLSLTESSIRDYVQRMFKKALPLQKIRENNKKIFLSIQPEFKKILSLPSLAAFFELKQE